MACKGAQCLRVVRSSDYWMPHHTTYQGSDGAEETHHPLARLPSWDLDQHLADRDVSFHRFHTALPGFPRKKPCSFQAHLILHLTQMHSQRIPPLLGFSRRISVPIFPRPCRKHLTTGYDDITYVISDHQHTLIIDHPAKILQLRLALFQSHHFDQLFHA